MISTKIDKSHAKLMRKCWEGNVQKRCTMAEAVRSLEFILGSAADASPPAALAPPPAAKPSDADAQGAEEGVDTATEGEPTAAEGMCDVISSVLASAGDDTTRRRVAVAAAVAVASNAKKGSKRLRKSHNKKARQACEMDLRGPAAGQAARASGSMREVSSRIAPGALARAGKPPDAKVTPTVAEVDEEQANREEIERRILAAFEDGDLETAEQLGAMIQAMGSRFELDQKLPRMPQRANHRDGVARRMRDLEGALDSDDD